MPVVTTLRPEDGDPLISSRRAMMNVIVIPQVSSDDTVLLHGIDGAARK
jgi:hypothetical protein